MKLDVVCAWKELTDADLLAVYGGNGGGVGPEVEQNRLGKISADPIKNVAGAITQVITSVVTNIPATVNTPVGSPSTIVPIHIHIHEEQHNLQDQPVRQYSDQQTHQYYDQHQYQYDTQHQGQDQDQHQRAIAADPTSSSGLTSGSNASPSTAIASPSETGAAHSPACARSSEDAFGAFDS